MFRLAELDLGGVATAFGLLRLPAMPEIRDWKQRVKAKHQAGEVTDADPPWTDANVNVSCPAHKPIQLTGLVGRFCLRLEAT